MTVWAISSNCIQVALCSFKYISILLAVNKDKAAEIERKRENWSQGVVKGNDRMEWNECQWWWGNDERGSWCLPFPFSWHSSPSAWATKPWDPHPAGNKEKALRAQTKYALAHEMIGPARCTMCCVAVPLLWHGLGNLRCILLACPPLPLVCLLVVSCFFCLF